MRGLYTGERQLEELTQKQLASYAVELMRYQATTEFPDNQVDDWAIETQIAYSRHVTPIFTEYRDENGQSHLAEVITETDGKLTGGLWYKCRKCQEKVSSKKEIDDKGGVMIHGTDNFGRPLKS